jgi:hypothetical protein
MKRVSITDYSKIIPFEKETYEKELSKFSEGVGRRVVDGLTSMELTTRSSYRRADVVLRASAYANKRISTMMLLQKALNG